MCTLWNYLKLIHILLNNHILNRIKFKSDVITITILWTWQHTAHGLSAQNAVLGGMNFTSYHMKPDLQTEFLKTKKILVKKRKGGLPWWRSGWESACQCRGCGFEPWSGKIPHAAEQLGPWATITEPACLEPVLRNKRGRDSERPTHRDEEWPPLAATGEGPRTETKTQHSQK